MSDASDDVCPVCRERMPPDTWRGIDRHRILCCGKQICIPCCSILEKRQGAFIADVLRARAAGIPSPGELQRQIKFLKGALKCPLCSEKCVSGDDQKEFQGVQSRAEQHGWDWAQWRLGVYYLHGRGVRADAKKAAIWFKKAAAQGNHRAENELGKIYNFGKGVKRSHPEAARWYQKAADAGFAPSQFHLGKMLNRGEGVPKNTTEGARLLTLSAEQGYPDAQCVLAIAKQHG
jgi:hypothetical protein